MSPFDLEKNIRSKMRDREIEPSASAWDRLEEQLDSQKPKSLQSYKKLYAVAAILVLGLISVVFINDATNTTQEVVVEGSTETDNHLNSVPSPITNGVASEEIVTEKHNEPEITPNNTEDKPLLKSASQEMIAVETIQDKEIEKELFLETNEFLDEKALDVATEIRNLLDSKDEVSLDEVDLLLENARREIFLERTLNSPKTDALALLQDVEWELDQSFYDKVFYALGDQFKKLATAYAERNR